MNIEISEDEKTVTVNGKVYEQKEKPEKKYVRKRFEYYYNISQVAIYENEDEDDLLDNYNYNTGNYHETKEQAEYYKKCILARQKLKDVAMLLNEDWVYGEGSFWCFKVNGQMDCVMIDRGQVKFSDDVAHDDILKHITLEEIKLALEI